MSRQCGGDFEFAALGHHLHFVVMRAARGTAGGGSELAGGDGERNDAGSRCRRVPFFIGFDDRDAGTGLVDDYDAGASLGCFLAPMSAFSLGRWLRE